MATLLGALCAYIDDAYRCISITGSGGKTTAMIELAGYYARQGKRVLVSTTTKLELPAHRAYGCDTYFTDDRILGYRAERAERVFYAGVQAEKAIAPPLAHLRALMKTYDVLLLEADGARHMPLKLHTDFDPVVVDFTTTTLIVVGMSGWGQALGECCFGWNRDEQGVADDEAYLTLLHHERGFLKGAVGKTLILCNQAENTSEKTMHTLSGSLNTIPMFFGSLQTNTLFFRKAP